MKKFLLNASVFLLLLVGLLFLLDIFITKGLRKMEDFRFQVWTDIVDAKIDADVIFLGNSRAAMHFDVPVFDSITSSNSYNLGIEGYPFNIQYLRFFSYVKHCGMPECVILNVDYSLFGYGTFSANKEQILPYFSDSYIRSNIVDLGFSKYDVTLPFYRYFGYTRELYWGLLEGLKIKHFVHAPAYKGFTPRDSIGYHDNNGMGNMANVDKRTVSLFEKFVEWCDINEVELILVQMPIYDYENTIHQIENYNSYTSLIDTIVHDYNLTYMNYGNDERFQSKELYNDKVHLHADAARIFTTILVKDLNLLKAIRIM